MKRPVKRRGYQDGGPVDPNSMSRQVEGGINTTMKIANMANAMKGMFNSGGTPASPSGPTQPPDTRDPTHGYKRGGPIRRVAGKPIGKDDGLIPAQKGEYVVRKSAVKKLGTKVLNQVNRGKLPASRGR